MYYTGHRINQVFTGNQRVKTFVWTLLIFWAITFFSSRLLSRFGANHFITALSWFNFFMMGLVVTCVFIFLCIDVFKLFYWGFSNSTGKELLDSERRKFLTQYTPWAVITASLTMAGIGLQQALKKPTLFRVKVPKKNLHPDLEGLKIVQISDLHVGDTISKPFVEQVVQMAMDQKPDIIALTGDLLDGYVENLEEDLEPLKKLAAPLGVYYITGNHEYYWDLDATLNFANTAGFQVMLNKHKMVQRGNAKLMVIGIPDQTSLRMDGVDRLDVMAAVQGAGPSDYKLFLAHQPKSYVEGEKINCDLQLSGHTHAGQMFPANLFIHLFHRYYRGLNNHEGKFWVYVNQGTGYWGPPNRLGVPSEVTLIELTKSESNS